MLRRHEFDVCLEHRYALGTVCAGTAEATACASGELDGGPGPSEHDGLTGQHGAAPRTEREGERGEPCQLRREDGEPLSGPA